MAERRFDWRRMNGRNRPAVNQVQSLHPSGFVAAHIAHCRRAAAAIFALLRRVVPQEVV
jgi:hypothetical protein